ncbi:MAG: hypothetical protein U0W40_08095 [Acidimicrobiia bacterium]
MAVTDPDPDVAGQGIERLRAAGITVDVGLHADDVRNDSCSTSCTARRGAPSPW